MATKNIKLKLTISVLTALTILFSIILPSSATTIDSEITSEQYEYDLSEYNFSNVPNNIADLDNVSLTAIDITEDAAEQLDTVVFLNDDGSYTLRQFDTNIKYVDDLGKIKFIDNTIMESDVDSPYSFENTESYFQTYFPENINEGIFMTSDNVNITMSPLDSENSGKPIVSQTIYGEECVEYADALGINSDLQYLPVNTGLKENIILNERPENNIFRFIISLGDLVPLQNQGETIELANADTNEIVALIGQIDARDSYSGDENYEFHTTLNNYMTIDQLENTNEYLLTLIIDDNFLNDTSTTYPVIIDPTITIAQSAMYDSSVYSAKASTNFYSSSYNPVGYHGSSYGEGKAFIGFNLNSFRHINAESITSAYYHTWEGSGKTNTMYVNVYAVKSSWQHNTITWNSSSSLSKTAVISSQKVNNNSWNNFYITTTVQQWVNYVKTNGYIGINPMNGIMIQSTATGISSKHFCSANYNGSLAPSLVINYNSNTMGLTYKPQKYNSNSTPVGSNSFQSRMNCYGYAIQVFYRDGNANYKQQPGEFETSTTYSSLLQGYSSAFNNKTADTYIKNMMYKDFKRFGWTITSTTATSATPSGKRKIALAISDGDYHFYVRNSDGTWSHKRGSTEVQNLSIDTRVVLTDSNISSCATQGGYNKEPVQYFFISKDAMVYNYPHANGQKSLTTKGTTIYW